MDVLREDITQVFDGPLSEVTGLPTGLLYAVVLTFAHVAGAQARSAIEQALRPLFGEPAESKDGWFRGRVRYAGQVPAEVKVGKASATVTVERRLRAQKVADLIDALSKVPGAKDLRLEAHRRVFQEPGASAGEPIQ